MNDCSPLPPAHHTLRIGMVFLALVVLILTLLGYWYLRVETAEITREKYHALAAIGELKSKQIQQWRKERLFEVERKLKQPALAGTVEQFLTSPNNQAIQEALQKILTREMVDGEWLEALLFSPDGTLLFATGNLHDPVDEATLEAVQKAGHDGGIVFSDFFRSPGGLLSIDVATTIRNENGSPLAVMVLRSNVGDHLFPAIQSWPTPSRSAETLLIERKGDDVLFLNELRHQTNTALSLRIPLTNTRVPSVQAILGREGIFQGTDYRGVEVLGDLHAIPGSPWFMVAKMDTKEIFADMHYRTGVVIILIGLLILLAVALMVYHHRQRQSEITRNLILTGHRQLELERDQYFKFFMLSSDPMCIADPFGCFRQVNPAFVRLTGYREEELLSRPFLDFVLSEDRRKTTEEMERQVNVRASVDFENRYLRKDGTVIVLSWMAYFDKKDGVTYATARDITERKETELKLARHSLSLQEANKQLKNSIQNAEELAVKARAATRTKSEFLAVMSHELRTPLNGVIGFAEILSETPLDTEQKKYAKTIRECGDHLLDVVNDILDFSSIEKGSMQIKPALFDMAELLESVCASIRKTAGEKGLEFHCETADEVPGKILGDMRRIRQILLNLLGNAVKFTAQGSVLLRVLPSPRETGTLSLDFIIEDTGPGIPPTLLGSLFKPFTQADSTTHRQFPGTGLGLAISQRLAQAMGGSISVVSNPGKGSTFTFHLPLSGQTERHPVPPPSPRSTPQATPQKSDKPVLIVEDDRVNRLLAGKLLQSFGHTVEYATNGSEAVSLFVPGKFSAILMDMQMPVMDGMQATRAIRSLESGPRIPIIALTANVLPGDREKCLAAGMDDFLTKPFKKDELAEKLARATRS